MRPPVFRGTFLADDELVVAVHGARARFEGLVARADGADACWEWQGNRSKRPDGSLSYGRFGVAGKVLLAHRVAWILENGTDPGPGVIRHRCDNVACVRPSHLLIGTQAQNLADMRERGRARFNRFPSGAGHPNAKITDEIAAEVRRLRSDGVSLAKIGAAVGLHATTVHDIVTGKTWRAA